MSVGFRVRFEEAVTKHRAGDTAAAEAVYRELINEAPHIDRAFSNLVTLLRSENRYGEAEITCREWVRTHPHSSHARYRLGLLLLRRGSYKEGWEFYENRVDIPEHAIKRPSLFMPEWKGDRISSLLVWFEQGFGDCIQFGRYIPALRASGIRVSMVVQPSLYRLFEPICDAVYVAGAGSMIPQHDAWCLVGSLPHLTGWEPPPSYLEGSDGGKGLGVVCRGNERPDPRRSLDRENAARLQSMLQAVDLLPDSTGARDFLETSKIIDQISEVVTIDTAVAHLSLAMGKPTTILLPIDACWRWGDQADQCKLYPAARIVRQTKAGVWTDVIDSILENTTAHNR